MKKKMSIKAYLTSMILMLVSSLLISFVAFTYAAYLNEERHKHSINVNFDYSEYFESSEDSNGDNIPDVYNIASEEQLLNLSKLVRLGVFGPTHTFKLTNDININDENFKMLPIGSDETPFYSTFDGDGHTISNLKVYGKDLADVGLFGYVSNGAVIKNLLLDTPTVLVDGSFTSDQYTDDPFLIRDKNPFRAKFGTDLDTLAKSITLTPTGTSNEKDLFSNFTINYTSSNNIELSSFPIRTYVNKTAIVNSSDGFNFSLNNNYGGDSAYFTVEVYIEGLILDDATNNYFYSRFSLEKFKVYLKVEKDKNGNITSKGFIQESDDLNVYRKTIESLPTHIVSNETYNYYNQHVVYAGIVAGHLDGNASYIGVKNGTLQATNRPYRSNSILIGKKIDDDDISSLSRESINFTRNEKIGNNLNFDSDKGTQSNGIDSDTNNKYISNFYTNDAYGFSSLAKNNDYLKIYGSQNQSGDADNLKFVSLKNENNEMTRFLAFRDSIDCYHTISEKYSSIFGNFNGSKNMFKSNCIYMWITSDNATGFLNTINNLLGKKVEFYLNFSFNYILYDTGYNEISNESFSKAKIKIMSSTKRSSRKDMLFYGYDYYSYSDNEKYKRDDGTYNSKTLSVGSRGDNEDVGYVKISDDAEPLRFRKSEVTPCKDEKGDITTLDGVKTYNENDVKYKNISIATSTDMYNVDNNFRERTPVFCLGLDLSECDPNQISFNLLDFTVTLSTLNGNYSSDPLTVDFYSGTPTYNDETWSSWPKYSNVKVGVSCFSKLVNEEDFDESNNIFKSTYPKMSFIPFIPSNYSVSTSRSNDTNNKNVITITYSGSPDTSANPENDKKYYEAAINQG